MISSKHYKTQQLTKSKCVFILANLYFISASSLITLLILPVGYILASLNKFFPRKITGKTVRQYIYYYGRMFCYVNTPFLPISITNNEEANKHKPCIMVANHQSFLDLFLFAMQKCNNSSYMVKSWPFKFLFFFAPMMHAAEYINIEQSDPEEIETHCLNLLRSGTNLIIFPEGKRTRTGELGRFHSGAFRLACLANVPIVPVILENTYAIFPIGSKFFYPQRIKIKLLQAIHPTDFTASDLVHRDMMRFTYKQYIEYFTNSKQGVSHA